MSGTRLTFAAATERLPFVAPVAADAVVLSARITAAEAAYAREKSRPQPSQIKLNEGRLETRRMRAELDLCHADARVAGGLLADAGRGIVDFPGEFDGTGVLLCWRPGDERVEHWHGEDEAHDARRAAFAPAHVG